MNVTDDATLAADLTADDWQATFNRLVQSVADAVERAEKAEAAWDEEHLLVVRLGRQLEVTARRCEILASQLEAAQQAGRNKPTRKLGHGHWIGGRT